MVKMTDRSTAVGLHRSRYESTRVNSQKLLNVHVKYDLKKCCFSNRLIGNPPRSGRKLFKLVS